MPSAVRSLRASDAESFIRHRCFPAADGGLVGIELEQLALPFDRRGTADHSAVDGAARALGPLPGGSTVTFEPGGQVELSSPPRRGPSASCALAAGDLGLLSAALGDIGVDLVAVGLDPRGRGPRVVDTARYRAMETYFDAAGPQGRTMMCATAALQVNLDVGAFGDHARRWQLAHDLGPVLVAAFANSPFADGAPSGWRCGRAAVWSGIDPSRTRPAHRAGDGGDDPAAAWADYALAATVMMVQASDGAFRVERRRLPFGRWIHEGHELGFPTLDDLDYHLGTLFPPVRPRGWLELRMIDAVPGPWWRVAVAVAATVLDDAGVAEAVGPALEASAHLWSEAARYGLGHPDLATAASTCFGAVVEALPRSGADAATTAATEEFRDRYVRLARCPADDLLDDWRRHGEVQWRSPALEAAWS